jgi:signal transduction histidine kinase
MLSAFMLPGRISHSSRTVLVMFLGVAVLSTAVLAVLGWKLVEQDRQLEETSILQKKREAADAFAQALAATLDDHRRAGHNFPDSLGLPDESLLLTIRDDHLSVDAGTLAYYPSEPEPLSEAPPGTFERGEHLERALGDNAGAAREYSGLAMSPDITIRAGALGRLARVQRHQHFLDQALRTYNDLSAIKGRIGIAGYPLSLYARLGRASALAEAGRTDALAHEARSLARELVGGTWPLSRAEYRAHREEIVQWLGSERTIDDRESVQRAEAVEWLWQSRTSLDARGARELDPSSGPALVAWVAAPGLLRAGVAGPAYLSAQLAQVHHDISKRRRLLIASLLAIGVVLMAGWYFILRAIAREQRSAQLQSDFVSAVSHEFRSPLTSMAYLAEMLDEDRVPSEHARRTSYGVLVRDTSRLRRLVEDLLDFREFEEGSATLRFERLDVSELVRSVVTEFAARAVPGGYHLELQAPEAPLMASVDREALTRAIGNLLDNAVKYSPDSRTVWVDVSREMERIAISVRDRGIGIPVHEQRHVFDRFVRGAMPKALRIKGTGIGLAMVRHIVRAHGGEVRLTSEPGQGSRFTILIDNASPFSS